MGHKEPLAAGLGCLAKTVEHIAEEIIPLRSVTQSKRQIRRHNDPPLIRNLARIPPTELYARRSIVDGMDLGSIWNDQS